MSDLKWVNNHSGFNGILKRLLLAQWFIEYWHWLGNFIGAWALNVIWKCTVHLRIVRHFTILHLLYAWLSFRLIYISLIHFIWIVIVYEIWWKHTRPNTLPIFNESPKACIWFVYNRVLICLIEFVVVASRRAPNSAVSYIYCLLIPFPHRKTNQCKWNEF